MSPTPSYLLGTTFALVGIGSLIAPLTTARLFGMAAVPSTVFISRMLGCRDLVLGGGILMTATAPKQQLRAVLFAANIINAIDIVSALVSYAEGNLAVEAWAVLSGAAAMVLGLGMWGVNSL